MSTIRLKKWAFACWDVLWSQGIAHRATKHGLKSDMKSQKKYWRFGKQRWNNTKSRRLQSIGCFWNKVPNQFFSSNCINGINETKRNKLCYLPKYIAKSHLCRCKCIRCRLKDSLLAASTSIPPVLAVALAPDAIFSNFWQQENDSWWL
jgi:hypothetical protein